MDAVFHVAAKAGVWGRKQDFVRANILGTRNILQGCKEHKVPYLIHTVLPALSSMVSRSLDKTNPYHMDQLALPLRPNKAVAERSLSANSSDGLYTLHYGLI